MDSVEQKFFPSGLGFPARINIRRLSQRQAGDAVRHLTQSKLRSQGQTIAIGIACHVSEEEKVKCIALSNPNTVFCLTVNEKVGTWNKVFLDLLEAGGAAVGDDGPNCCLVGFSMARTAVQAYQAVRRRVLGVDLASVATSTRDAFTPVEPADLVLNSISKSADRWEIAKLWNGDENSAVTNVCLQAWLAACVGGRNISKLADSIKIDTNFLHTDERERIVKMIIQMEIIENHKPVVLLNDFSNVTLNKAGKAEIVNSRYKSRVRRNDNAQVVITNKSGCEYFGNAQRQQGKRTTINMQGHHRDIGEVTQIKVIGRQAPTNSEIACERLIRNLLTGKKSLLDCAFIRILWFPGLKKMKVQNPITVKDVVVDNITAKMRLNDSQRRVVRGMVGDLPILVAHGPPGTGKTTTIAAASRIWDLAGKCVWIVAHSNVAVKNIAETLFKKEVDFKLLISKEFFQEWHEHLYEEILLRVIRSDELPNNITGMDRIIGNSNIVLCTLSMLSNPALLKNGTFTILPVERLIIDEASQINIYEFMHVFKNFQKNLQKVCFFGDPEQLPPFGQDRVPSIETIYDLRHITDIAGNFFLDTQYRMPIPVGNFISSEIYRNQLKSQHAVTDPRCVKFINVSPPRAQESKSGFSWINEAEVTTIVHLVKNYYQNKNFAVVTPYDAQRAEIERALKAQNLRWKWVYTLDSFQGNEADYLLISIVRTGTQPGFLTSRKRMNVLLTRCRKAAIIVTSKIFMELGGAQTLLGRMLLYWTNVLKASGIWIDWSLVSDGSADLPDASGAKRSQLYVQNPSINTISVSYPTPSASAACVLVPLAYRGPSTDGQT